MKIILLIVGIVSIIVSGILDTRKELTVKDYLSNSFYALGILAFTWLFTLLIDPELKPQEQPIPKRELQQDTLIKNDTAEIIILHYATNREERDNNN